METKYIATLREEINLGSGFTKRLDASSYMADSFVIPGFVEFKLTDSRTVLVNKNNIRSIVTVNA